MHTRDSEHYEDSHDMIERIRKLRDAAEIKMNAFGDPSGYDVRIIRGRKSELDASAAEGKTNEV
jgi:hypothetical protein